MNPQVIASGDVLAASVAIQRKINYKSVWLSVGELLLDPLRTTRTLT